MEKRLPIALVLSLLFLYLYTSRLAPQPRPADAAGETQADPSGGAPGPSDAAPQVPARAGALPEAGMPAGGVAAVEVLTQAPAREVVLAGGDNESTWTSRGAALVAMHLDDYWTSEAKLEPLPIVGELDGSTANLMLRDLSGRYGLDQAEWELEETSADGQPRLVFQLRTADGLRFTRRVTARSSEDWPHSLHLELSVTNEGAERAEALTLVLQSVRGLVDEEAGSKFYGQPTALAVVRKGVNAPEVVRWSGDKLRGDPRRISEGEVLLAAGCMTNYFASLLVPDEGTVVGQVYPVPVIDHLKLERRVTAKAPVDDYDAQRLRGELVSEVDANAAVDLQLWVPRLEPGETRSFGFELYTGPKGLETAALPGFDFLHPVIESTYGMWGFINRTLLQILRFFHGIFGNWGVAIILLTLLVKALLFPLNRRQQTSMAKYSSVMGRLKPQLEELKAKYKNNVRKYNEEQMKLVRAEGASPPLGGCLLMFLQFPIWISLFQILGTSIELRQSNFVGWINDLSLPDAMPFGFFDLATVNVLPLLMAAATMVQMRFQAKPADASQAQTQKIMGMIMPVFMLFFLYGYPSGLSLYIFTSSLIGIFEFQVIRRIWPVPGLPSPVAAKS